MPPPKPSSHDSVVAVAQPESSAIRVVSAWMPTAKEEDDAGFNERAARSESTSAFSSAAVSCCTVQERCALAAVAELTARNAVHKAIKDLFILNTSQVLPFPPRSEERRVGKECRSRGS